MERMGAYEIEANRFENHGGTCRNVIRTRGNVMKIDSENNIQSAYRAPKAPEQMWMPRAVQRQQLRTGCNDLCAASMVSYLTRLLALAL